MFKLIGGLLIVAACAFMGWQISKSFSKRPIELKQLINALQLLETEIAYAATPLPQALDRLAEQTEAPVSSFFRQVAEDLSAKHGNSAREAWQEALEHFSLSSFLGLSDLSILKSLGNNIGISDREDQCKHLRLAGAQLKVALSAAEEAAAKNVKLWNYVGVLGGLIIVLTLC